MDDNTKVIETGTMVYASDSDESTERSPNPSGDSNSAIPKDSRGKNGSAPLPEAFTSRIWKPGQSGNPAGKPKGSRNALAERFVSDLYEVWTEETSKGKLRGIETIRNAMRSKPADALKVFAAVLPKDVKISLETMSDGELSRKIDQLTQSLGIRLTPAPKVIDVDPEGEET